jgi:hypothetical protein
MTGALAKEEAGDKERRAASVVVVEPEAAEEQLDAVERVEAPAWPCFR